MGAVPSAQYFQWEDMDKRWKEAIIPITRNNGSRRNLISIVTEHQPQQDLTFDKGLIQLAVMAASDDVMLTREIYLAGKAVVVEFTMAYIDNNKPSQILRREVVSKEGMGGNQIEVVNGVGLGSVVEQEITAHKINYSRDKVDESDDFILINVRIDLLKLDDAYTVKSEDTSGRDRKRFRCGSPSLPPGAVMLDRDRGAIADRVDDTSMLIDVIVA